MYKEKIDAYIDSKKEEMIEDLCTLVRINSQRGEAKENMPFGEGAAEVLAAAETLAEKYGFKTKNYDNYVVAADFSEEEKGLDILAHLDVVPVTDDWKVTKPFEPKIVDGRIYGRGTADDKGPAIAALYAMRAIKELGIPMKKSVRLILGSDEECGSSDLAYYFNIEKEAPYSFTPDADFPLINIEKGRMAGGFSAEFKDGLQLPGVVSFKCGDKVNVVPQRASMVVAGLDKETVEKAAEEAKAVTGVSFAVKEYEGEKTADAEASWLQIDALGQAAHAASPQEGKNALTASLYLLSTLPLAASEGQIALDGLNKLFPHGDVNGKTVGIFREEEQSGPLTLCFSMLTYSPERLDGAFDARLPIGCTEKNTKYPVIEAMKEFGIVLEDKPMTKPHCVSGDSDFVKTLLGSYERYTGIKGKPLSTGGGTYVHDLERGVAFGCMMGDVDNHMHGDDEFMVLDTLFISAKIFADAIVKICNEL